MSHRENSKDLVLDRDAIAQGHFRPDLEVHQFAFEFLGIQLSTMMWRGLRRETHTIALARKTMANLFQRSSYQIFLRHNKHERSYF